MIMRIASSLLLLAALAYVPACGPGDSTHTPHKAGSGAPNVVFIVMDTTAAGRCSVNGYDRPTTPQLEKIAKGGINFRNTWSPSGWTAPAHASMFTGLRPEHHGLRHGNRMFLWDDSVTLAELLQAAGYSTGCFTNNSYVTPDHGLLQGFDKYIPLFEDENLPLPTSIPTHSEALDWVRQVSAQGGPFFLFINDMEPHLPYLPPEEFEQRFVAADASKEGLVQAFELTNEAYLKHNLGIEPLPPEFMSVMPDLYDAEIACLDHEIGRFVAELESAGLLENTLLVITGDHGENLGNHGLVDHKFSLHRTLLHVPLIVRLPRGARAGEVRDEVVRLEDLFPTVLEACGLPIPPGIDAESLLGNLAGRTALALRDYPAKYMDDMEEKLGSRAGFEKFAFDMTSTFDGRIHRIDFSDGRKLVYDVIEDPEELHPLGE